LIVTTRLPEGISKRKLKEKAKEYGMPYTQLIQLGIQLMVDWDKEFVEILKTYSEAMHMTIGAVIKGMVLRSFAEQAAHEYVWGTPQFLPDLVVRGNRPLTGPELFEFLKNYFIKEEEEQKSTLDRLEASLRESSTKKTKNKKAQSKINAK